MRRRPIVWLSALLCAATLTAAKDAPLEFPEGIAAAAPAPAWLLGQTERLNAWIGGYPPRIRDQKQRQEIYHQWRENLRAARAIQRRDGDTEETLLLLGRLYRQGHNLDVKECGDKAFAIFEQALAAFPESDPLHLEASYFYLSINPKFAPKGEAALKKLRQLRGTDRDLSVERGFIFAYLHQNRIDEAKKQIEHCLTLAPDDKMLLQFRGALKNQQSIEVSQGATPPPQK